MSTEGAEEGDSASAVEPPRATEERRCRVMDSEFDAEFTGFEYSSPGWIPLTRPRGVSPMSRDFDAVAGEQIFFGHDFANAGFTSAWCRRLNGEMVCLEIRTAGERRDELTELDFRSATGRYVFYSRSMLRGFRVYDLATMRNVTPAGAERIVSTRWADFSRDDRRLFVVLEGQLHVFVPPAGGGPWQPENGGDTDPMTVPLGTGDVAGLFALDDDHLLLVHRSGVISHFNWQTGAETWRRTFDHLGGIRRAVISPHRGFVLLVGESGGRLVATGDGLVASGLLLPPAAMSAAEEIPDYFSDAFVSDKGTVEVRRDEAIMTWSTERFAGNITARLREIAADSRREDSPETSPP
jgi:hypothetical protein